MSVFDAHVLNIQSPNSLHPHPIPVLFPETTGGPPTFVRKVS